MANYCSNSVQFNCNSHQLAEIVQLFEQLAAKENLEKKGQLPDFIQAERGHMSQNFWHNNTLHYETRWCPNIEVMQAIADYFGVGFSYTYEEMSNMIYGFAEYNCGVLTDISPDLTELASYSYDEKKDVYLFEGAEYHSDYKILKRLLGRKKSKLCNRVFG